MSTHSDSNSDSNSDSDEAPQIISSSSAKKMMKSLDQSTLQSTQGLAKSKKDKLRRADERSKLAKREKRLELQELQRQQKQQQQQEEEEEENEEEDEEEDQMELDEVEEQEEESRPNYLDPSLFASAAEAYTLEEAKNAVPAPGMGKHRLKKLIRAQKQLKAIEVAERANQLGQGGSRRVGGKVVQHLPTKSPLAPNLTSTTHRPSHSSAAKFLTSRLYSKKRMISVLDAGTANHAPISERKKETGKMSAMSKYLLGLGPDPEIKVAGNKSEKKRSLLLQAQGVRKSATRSITSRLGKVAPARDFAVSQGR